MLDLIRQGKFDPDPMTVNRVDWDDAQEALSDLRAKTVVSRGGARERQLVRRADAAGVAAGAGCLGRPQRVDLRLLEEQPHRVV